MVQNRLDSRAIEAFEPDVKVGLVATKDPGGRPHLSLITSLSAKDESHLMWGQFTEGRSKEYPRERPEVGFLVMTLDRKVWRGTARWTRAQTEGPDHQAYNRRPMFRYNAYFGIHTVHHLDLVSVEGPRSLPIAGMLAGHGLLSARRLLSGKSDRPALNHWSRKHMAAPLTIKFVSWVDEDGFPRIVPGVPCLPLGSGVLGLVPSVYGRELRSIPKGAQVAVFGLNLQTESVLVRGTLEGFSGLGPLSMGRLAIDFVYNSLPPLPGQIFPPLPLEPVTTFE